MRGRDLFRIVQPALKGAALALRLLPAPVVSGTWWLVDWMPGYLGMGLRYVWARRLCRRCGSNVMIGRHVDIRNWGGLSFGDNVTLHGQCYVDAIGGVDILDDVSIAHATSILSFEHGFDDPRRPIKDQPLQLAPVSIGPDAWIGAGVRILAGVTIGRRSVIAAGAVVPRGVLGGAIYGGVPARALKVLDAAIAAPAHAATAAVTTLPQATAPTA